MVERPTGRHSSRVLFWESHPGDTDGVLSERESLVQVLERILLQRTRGGEGRSAVGVWRNWAGGGWIKLDLVWCGVAWRGVVRG